MVRHLLIEVSMETPSESGDPSDSPTSAGVLTYGVADGWTGGGDSATVKIETGGVEVGCSDVETVGMEVGCSDVKTAGVDNFLASRGVRIAIVESAGAGEFSSLEEFH